MQKKLLDLLNDKFQKSHLAANVALGSIMLVLEKLLESEFNCPCSPMWNALYTSAFFIIPTVVSFTLMLLIQNCICKRGNDKRCPTCDEKNCGKTIISFCMAIVWLVLVLYDGQYFACACTDWEGSYVSSEYLKWCKPENVTEEGTVQLMQRVKYFYLYSQLIAMALFMCIWVALAVFTVLNCCELLKKSNEGEQSTGRDPKEHGMTANEGHSEQTNCEMGAIYVNKEALDNRV